MATGRHFVEGVRRAAVGTPYVVTETDDGFDVTREAVDRRLTHHVKVLADDAFSITDEWRRTTRGRASASARVMRGRILTGPGREGRELIEGVANDLGLEQRRGVEERVGMFFAALALGGIAIGAVVVLVLALVGAF